MCVEACGVDRVSVNLLTNSMQVEYDETVLNETDCGRGRKGGLRSQESGGRCKCVFPREYWEEGRVCGECHGRTAQKYEKCVL